MFKDLIKTIVDINIEGVNVFDLNRRVSFVKHKNKIIGLVDLKFMYKDFVEDIFVEGKKLNLIELSKVVHYDFPLKSSMTVASIYAHYNHGEGVKEDLVIEVIGWNKIISKVKEFFRHPIKANTTTDDVMVWPRGKRVVFKKIAKTNEYEMFLHVPLYFKNPEMMILNRPKIVDRKNKKIKYILVPLDRSNIKETIQFGHLSNGRPLGTITLKIKGVNLLYPGGIIPWEPISEEMKYQ